MLHLCIINKLHLANSRSGGLIIIAGVDEAGRGCVLGPLVICIAVAEKEDEARLKEIGAKDSKLLNPSARSRLFGKIKNICVDALVVKIDAEELNELMKKHSLNEIEAMKIGNALNTLKVTPDLILVDSPDTEADRFKRRIRKYFEADSEIITEHKADFNYPIVSAASIIAKVERDGVIELIKKELEYDFGSGYTSDDRTINFLKKNLHRKDVQKYVRKRWDTVEKIQQKKLTEFNFYD